MIKIFKGKYSTLKKTTRYGFGKLMCWVREQGHNHCLPTDGSSKSVLKRASRLLKGRVFGELLWCSVSRLVGNGK